MSYLKIHDVMRATQELPCTVENMKRNRQKHEGQCFSIDIHGRKRGINQASSVGGEMS